MNFSQRRQRQGHCSEITGPGEQNSVWPNASAGLAKKYVRLRELSATLVLLVVVCGAVALTFVSGCRTVPETQRKQLLLVSEAQETQLGADAYSEILQEEKLADDQKLQQMVERVGQRIAAVSGRPDFDWEFRVIESDQQNAFCLPGGKVAVYTGILPVCRTEAGLAVVMSHEIAHAIARHGAERMTHQTVSNGVKQAAGYLMRDADQTKQEIMLTAYGVVSEYGAILPFSRKHELEADAIGVMLMAEAGYDPSVAPEFWERFSATKAGGAPMEFLSTHPSDARRSAQLRQELPEALQRYRDAPRQFGLGETISGAGAESAPSGGA